jgi:hypothetical protein
VPSEKSARAAVVVARADRDRLDACDARAAEVDEANEAARVPGLEPALDALFFAK